MPSSPRNRTCLCCVYLSVLIAACRTCFRHCYNATLIYFNNNPLFESVYVDEKYDRGNANQLAEFYLLNNVHTIDELSRTFDFETISVLCCDGRHFIINKNSNRIIIGDDEVKPIVLGDISLEYIFNEQLML